MKVWGAAREGLLRWRELLLVADTRVTAARLTLLLLVLYGEQHWDFKVPTIMLAALGMAAPPLARQWWYWLTLAAIQASGLAGRLYLVDNHKVLMLYWTLALALSMRDPQALALQARRLVGLCFAFATFWKATTTEFVDGSFLHFTMLTDERFANFARIVGGVAPEVLAADKALVSSVHDGRQVAVQLLDTGASDVLASLATWWTLATEGSIALLFLLDPRAASLRALRNIALVSFISLTYPIATVIGFGWLLTIMGYAQTRRQERAARLAYLCVFLALQLYLIPWTRALGL
jgi:hypothetical protein